MIEGLQLLHGGLQLLQLLFMTSRLFKNNLKCLLLLCTQPVILPGQVRIKDFQKVAIGLSAKILTPLYICPFSQIVLTSLQEVFVTCGQDGTT